MRRLKYLLAFVLSTPAAAQFTTVCVTGSVTTGAGPCASEGTAAAQYAQQIAEYARQLLQLQQQIQQTAYMAQNLTKSPVQFDLLATNIAQLANAVQVGQGIAYSMGNFDQRYGQAFPGYSTYSANGGYYSRYAQWTQTVLDTIRGTMRAANMSYEQQTNTMGLIQILRTQLQSADGNMQALEVVGQMADQQASATHQLRDIMLADLQSKQAFQAAEIQRQAETAATMQQFFRYSGRNSDGQTFGAGWH